MNSCNPSSAPEIYGIEDKMATERLVATEQAFQLGARAVEVRASIEPLSVKNAIVVWVLPPFSFLHPAFGQAVVNTMRSARAYWLERQSMSLLPPSNED